MGLDMKESGMKRQIKEMEEDIKYGRMAAYMKDTGRMIRQTAEAD